MRRCSAKPYEGNENYIFVSYCHKDKKYIFPVIEQLVADGYRVWYDEGIDPGSEWPEIIAQHLNNCSACIAFISENSLSSHNCRREINFALLKKKPFISVVIEPVAMSLGMEMQLSATQAIFKYTLSTDKEFFDKLYDAKCLISCMGTPNPGIVVSSPNDYENDTLHGLFDEKDLRRETFSDKWFIEAGQENGTNQTTEAWLVREKTGETIKLVNGETKLGRSETMSDYSISGNSAIGRLHAKVIAREEGCFIVDNNSKNRTFLNSKELEPEKEYPIENGDSIRLANEKFTFHQSQE